MLRMPVPAKTSDQKRIEKLEYELSQARQDIIDLMSEENRRLLMSYLRCETRMDTYSWANEIAGQLVGAAELIVSERQERAFCPLCGDGSSSAYESGFSVPIGLNRHLTGWGNTRQCSVAAAAAAAALDFWNEKFTSAEKVQQVKTADLLAKRRAVETLYLTEPTGKPCLSDEGLHFRSVRDKAGMVWAENRLEGLRFRVQKAENVQTHVDEREQFFVYADIRASGSIEFNAYTKPAEAKSGKARGKYKWLGNYHLQDRWKNDLLGKYERWITDVIAASVLKQK